MSLTVNNFISSKRAPTFGSIGTSFFVVTISLGGVGEGVADVSAGCCSEPTGFVNC